jgi:hypothetical protein
METKFSLGDNGTQKPESGILIRVQRAVRPKEFVSMASIAGSSSMFSMFLLLVPHTPAAHASTYH